MRRRCITPKCVAGKLFSQQPLKVAFVGLVAHAWVGGSCRSFSCAMELTDHGLHSALRCVLMDAQTNGLNKVLGKEFVASLLSEEEEFVSADHLGEEASPTRSASKYALCGPVLDRPYTATLAYALEHCLREGHFLRPPLPENDGLTSLLAEDAEEIAQWQECVAGCSGSAQSIISVLSFLGCRGIRLALGQRRTVGSCDVLPPSRRELIQAFSALHSEGAGDSSGSRGAAPSCQLPAKDVYIYIHMYI